MNIRKTRPALVSVVLGASLWALPGAAGFAAGDEEQLTAEQAFRVQALKPKNHAQIIERMNELYPMRWISRGGDTQRFERVPGRVGAFPYEYEGMQYAFDDLFQRVSASGLVVLHQGKLVYDRYRPGSNENTHFHSYSAGKAFSATLVGVAIADGKIRSVNDQVTDYIPELKGTAYEGVTIKNVLQMSSGVRWREEYGVAGSDIVELRKRVQIMADTTIADMLKKLPRVAPPGTVFNYSTVESHVLTWLVKQATGKDPAAYMSERLWSRVGMQNDAGWLLDHPLGMEAGGGGLLVSVPDYARIGQLMLNDGVWNGERILPKGWRREATIPDAPQVQYGKLTWGQSEGYQYQWFAVAGRDEAFCAEGSYGQMIYVNPAKQLVVAMTSVWPKQWDQELKKEAWAAFESVGSKLSGKP